MARRRVATSSMIRSLRTDGAASDSVNSWGAWTWTCSDMWQWSLKQRAAHGMGTCTLRTHDEPSVPC